MLCSRHFGQECYTNVSRTQLNKFAIPTGAEPIMQRLRNESKSQQTNFVTGSVSSTSMTATKCCVPSCMKTRADNVILHVFPEPDNECERFDLWLEATGGGISDLSKRFIFKNRRICHLHFEKQYFTRSRRLSSNAIPTLNLPGSSKNLQMKSRTLENSSLSENEDDGSGSEFLTREDIDTGMNTANANSLLQLRLINDSILDEPIYEVLTDDDTYDKTDINSTPQEKYMSTAIDTVDISSNGNKVKEKDTSTSEKPSLPDQQDTTLKEKDISFWKMKLVYILHNTQFCGICLDVGVEMNAINDDFEIIDNERTYRKTLRDIVDKVFKETERIACSKICNNCTKKLIQSYIFIHNTEEKSAMLNYYLHELYIKTCYISDNVSKNSHNAQSKIHNAVIALDNKDISENLDNSKLIVNTAPDRNIEDYRTRKRKLKCVNCTMVLPSYRAWKIHERTTHKQNYRCRICLQSYKTLQDLTTHLKMQCTFYCTSDFDKHICISEKGNKNVYECQYCKKQLDNLLVLQEHENSCEHVQRQYLCNKDAMSPDLLRNDRKSRILFSCSLCERVFLNDLKRKKHILQVHNRQKKKIPRRLDCVVCQTKFVTKAALVLHLRYHRPYTKYSCKVCKAQFDNLRKFKAHNRKHTLSFRVCEVCGKRMSQFLFKKHFSTHLKF